MRCASRRDPPSPIDHPAAHFFLPTNPPARVPCASVHPMPSSFLIIAFWSRVKVRAARATSRAQGALCTATAAQPSEGLGDPSPVDTRLLRLLLM